MSESLDIDPLLREYLEQRRGLTGDEVDRLLVEWNHHGSLTDFLASKALIDRTTAKMLITAQKGYLASSPEEIRTVLGIRFITRRVESKEAQSAQAAKAIAPVSYTHLVKLGLSTRPAELEYAIRSVESIERERSAKLEDLRLSGQLSSEPPSLTELVQALAEAETKRNALEARWREEANEMCIRDRSEGADQVHLGW